MPNKTWTAEEILFEEHFKKHTARDDTARYIVRLRHEGQSRLGELYEQAKRRFHQLEQRFQEHPELHQAYSEFMQEYEELGHMNQINPLGVQRRVTFDSAFPCRRSNVELGSTHYIAMVSVVFKKLMPSITCCMNSLEVELIFPLDK